MELEQPGLREAAGAGGSLRRGRCLPLLLSCVADPHSVADTTQKTVNKTTRMEVREAAGPDGRAEGSTVVREGSPGARPDLRPPSRARDRSRTTGVGPLCGLGGPPPSPPPSHGWARPWQTDEGWGCHRIILNPASLPASPLKDNPG